MKPTIENHLLNQKIKVEILWWAFTAILTTAVLLPIWQNAPTFPFFFANAFFIIVFVTFTRYTFLLPTTLLARSKWIKVFVMAIAGILFFVMSTALSDFHNFLEQEGLQTIVTHLNVQQQTSVINYIKNEMIFFGVGSVIAGIVLPFRMLKSIWRMKNRGTV